MMTYVRRADGRSTEPLQPPVPPNNSSKPRHSLRILHDVLKALGLRYAYFVGATIALGLVSLLPPQLFRYFTETSRRIASLDAASFVRDLGIFGLIVAGALFLSAVGTTLCQEWFRLILEAELRRRVISRIHRLPIPVLDRAQRGEWLTRMTGDLRQVEDFLTRAIPGQLQQLAVVLGVGALFVSYTGVLALLPLAAAILVAAINVTSQRRLAPVLSELRTLHGGVFQLLIESLEGIRTIRAHGAERQVERRFEARLVEINARSMRAVRVLGALIGSNEFLGQAFITGCLTLAAWKLSAGELTVGEVLVYPFFLGIFYGNVQGLAGAAYAWNRFLIEGDRFGDLLYGYEQGTVVRNSSALELSRSTRITVTDLTFGHAGRRPLGPVDLRVAEGRLVALMGPSGCGKSTLLEVLAGLRPAQGGRVTFDAQGGTLWDSGGDAWGQGPAEFQVPIGACAFVEQHPYIFEGTLRDNLVFGQPGLGLGLGLGPDPDPDPDPGRSAESCPVDEARLWAALERVALTEFARRNGGLDHFLRDRGRNLSEGERYRVALARALLLGRPFLLLDEPFAALDAVSAEIVARTLDAERRARGILVVTHFLPPSLEFDRVFRFDAREVPSKDGVDATRHGAEIGRDLR